MKQLNFILLLLIGLNFTTKAQMVTGNQTLYGNEWIDYSQTYVKIPIAQDGIYRISAAQLQSAGVPLSTIAANRFQLLKLGQEVPIYTTTEANFGANDFIEFWGERNRSELDAFMYKDRKNGILNPDYSYINDTTMYFLTWRSTVSTKRVQSITNNLTNLPAKEPWFWHNETFSGTERAIWQDISGGSSVYLPEMNSGEGFGTAYSNNKTISINPQFIVAGQDGQLDIRWTGNHKYHFTTILANNTVLGRDTFNGFGLKNKSFVLPAAQIAPTMTVQITGSNESADNHSIGSINLRYARAFNFGNNRSFVFTMPASGSIKYLEITNFDHTGSAPILYDVTNNTRMVATLEGGLVKIALPPSVSERKLVLVGVNRISDIETIKPTVFVDLKKDGGNYIILSHPKFFDDGTGKNVVQEYANYRASTEGGAMKSTVIDINQIYDQFGYGIEKHPISIRNFAFYTKKAWSNPQYLLLVGKGREIESNRLDIAGLISKIDMPTWGYPGSDIMMVLGDTTIVPVMPIGRIPCTTTTDIKNYLDKVKIYERNLATLPQTLADRQWLKNVMHLSGGGNEGPIIKDNMDIFADTLKASKAGANVTTFYKNNLGPVQTILNDQIFDRINKGTSLITFYGHSAASTLDFDINNPDLMNNSGKYPLFIALGEAAGNCHQNSRGIGEDFIFYKDKGMSVFLGTTGHAFLNSLNNWATAFYKSLGTTHYGERIGDVTKGALASFNPRNLFNLNTNANDNGLKSVLQTFQLMGDPALRYFAAPGPDFLPDASSIKLTPSVLTTQMDSFDVTFNVANIGSHTSDSMSVTLRQELPNKTIVELAKKKIATPAYQNSFTWRVAMPKQGVAGQNRLHIAVDVDNNITELPALAAEANNDLWASTGEKGVPFYILDNTVRPVYPADFAIVNKKPIVLKASTSNALAKPQNYIVEIDTAATFNSPLKKRTVINQLGGVLKWQPDMNWTDNVVYYWRTAADSTAGVGYSWESSSFVYLSTSTEGWNQSHFYQYLGNQFTTLKVDSFDRKFAFGENLNSVDLRYNSNYPLSATPIYFVNNYQYGRNLGTPEAGIYAVVFDSRTGIPWIQSQYLSEYGQKTLAYSYSYAFQSLVESAFTGRRGFIDFLNKVPDRNYVLIFTVQQNQTANYRPDLWGQDSVSFGTNIFKILEAQGAKQVRSLDGTKPYAFAFQKNVGVLAERTALTLLEGAPISFNMVNRWYEGKMVSKIVGPAKEWQSLELAYKADIATPTLDSITFDVIGLTSDKLRDTLLFSKITTNTQSLSTINAKQYPYLKLRFYGYDQTQRTPPQLNYWRVFYKGLTELAVNPNAKYSFYKDTLQQGDQLKMEVNIENISNVDADSVLVKWTIRNDANVETNTFGKYAPLSKDGNFVANLTRTTKDLSGKNQISFEVNPNLAQPEQYTFNNYLQTSFYIEKDKKNPFLNVLFDGIRIMNNDIVSSKPLIIIELRDENKFLALNDTALFKLYVQSPAGVKTQIFFNDPSVKFNPATISATGINKATIEYRPIFKIDGVYQLIVKAKDISGNPNDVDYNVAFRIITKSSISDVLNYPNPFSTRTQFVYTLTGETIPSVFKIQIMSVSGRVVREITQNELGTLRIGTHRTDFVWDGRDEYGNQLANGVYLYRVIAKNADGKAFESYETGTADYFKKGIGKLVIMR
jgi:Peptidase family C25